jgi:hypothetical protein
MRSLPSRFASVLNKPADHRGFVQRQDARGEAPQFFNVPSLFLADELAPNWPGPRFRPGDNCPDGFTKKARSGFAAAG